MTQPAQWIYFFANGQADGGNEVKHLVGGKGASLGEMTRAGLDVPPGFTISAEACQHFYHHQQTWPDGLLDQVRASLERLEQIGGRPFGRGDNPLLLAVRSGAAQSMPGMMDTLLNVGLNPECVRALGQRTDNPRGAWETYYHFLLMYGRTVYGPQNLLEEKRLDHLVNDFLDGEKAVRVENLDAGQMEELCLRILRFFHSEPGVDFPTDPWDMLTGAILAVFRSWNSERALTYRRHHKFDGLAGTAVNVQVMCPSEVSGVMFTANPVQAGVDEIIIESSYGLGEAVVLGKVNPDIFVLDKQALTLRERRISSKKHVMATLALDGKERHGGQDAASLEENQVAELARLGLRVEDYFKVPCDIEWGLSGGRFYLLQARPIKLKGPRIDPAEREQIRQEEIAALRTLAEPRGTVWGRFNLAEILPEPLPMTWAIVRRFMSGKGGFGLMYRDLGFDPDPALDEVGIFDLICGRPYCNLSREPRMQYRNLPFENSFAQLKAEPARALYPQAVFNFRRAGWKFWLTLPLTLVKLAWAGRKLKRAERTFGRRFLQEIVPPFLEEVKKAEGEDLSKLTDRQLLEGLEHWTQRALVDFARESLKPTALAGIAMANLERTLAQRLKPFSRDAAKEQEAIEKGMKRAQGFVRELVMGVHPDADSDLAGGLRDHASGKLSREDFLMHFGHRGSLEMELAQPRFRENLTSLETSRTQPPDCSPQIDHEDRISQTWERLCTEAHLMPFQQAILEEDVQVLQEYLKLRETAKHHLMRGYALLRRYLQELDDRFHLDGGIYYLLPEELPALISTPKEDAAKLETWRQTIAGRRKRRDIALSLPVPQVLFSDDLEAIGRMEDLQGSDLLQGVPLSAGVAEGTAWVLHQAEDTEPPSEDYILVCPSTDPAWVPLFVRARALVMETGGVLSHGAIVAREFGLPAVAGISDVHRRLKTGQRLRVDGGTGKVNVIS